MKKIKINIKKISKRKLIIAGITLAVIFSLALGIFGGFKYQSYISEREENKYSAFAEEVYQNIQDNFWQIASDEELSNLFKLAVKQVAQKPYLLSENNKEGVRDMTERAIKELTTDEEKETFVTSICNLVLTSIQPQGRSTLYTQQQQKELAQKVNNINEEENLYETLGIGEDATTEEIELAYQEKLEKIESGEISEEEAEEIERAKEILSESETKERYDSTGSQATVFGKQIGDRIFYLQITRVSPTTLEDFYRVVNEADKTANEDMDTLILDLRDNIGGAIDILPQFLGPFIGKDQYAYEFFHQGDYEPYKTSTGWLDSLVRYKKVVVLVNEATQSSAEVMAATFKKYNVGVLVGKTTRGWGTVERVFELENQINSEKIYSLFLVHRLTLREDREPIEGRGVSPNIDIDSADWKEELLRYFESQSLVDTVEKLWNKTLWQTE
jgi:C-terminal processing protease CtpA/Prc